MYLRESTDIGENDMRESHIHMNSLEYNVSKTNYT